MTKAQYTPGPWALRPDGCDEDCIISPKTGRYVAKAVWQGGSSCEVSIVNQYDLALILNAPELFELLNLSLPYVEECEQFNKETRKGLSKQMRALIAKIEGA